jgi:hypothetical protein
MKFERTSSPKDASHLNKLRVELQAELDEFLANTPFTVDDVSYSAPAFDTDDVDVCSEAGSDGDDDDDDDGDDGDDGDDDNDEDHDQLSGNASCPERSPLPLPSYLLQEHMSYLMVPDLAEEELNLRQLHASEALHQLRLSLGLKSAMFRKSIANAKSQKKKTRAWRSLKAVEANVSLHTQAYRIAQHGLVRLHASPAIMAKFPVLKKEDLKMSRDVIEENRVGQWSEHVSWIWRLDGGGIDKKNSALMTESECSIRHCAFS